MAVTLNERIQVGPNSWLQTWSSTLTDPTYSIYVAGVLRAKTQVASITISLDDLDTVIVDVFDDDQLPGPVGETKADISWSSAASTKRYRIEEKIATVWAALREIEDDGRADYETRTEPLIDEVVHNFRVIAEGENGNESVAAIVDIEPVRHPDIPEVDYSFSDATKKVTLTEI